MNLDLDCGSGSGKYVSVPRGDICIDVQRPTRGIIPESFVVADIQNLPFKNNSFSSASAHNVLEHISYPEKAIREMLRVASKAFFTQDKLWSLGALQETEHLWIQLPGFIFKPFPRTILGMAFGNLLSKLILNRPFNIIFREKYHGKFVDNLITPHSFYSLKRKEN